MTKSNQIRTLALLALCALFVSVCSTSRFGIAGDSSVHLEDTVDWRTLADALRQEEQRYQAQRVQEQATIQLVSSVVTATPTPRATIDQAPAKLAYLQGGNLWVKELPNGNAVQLTSDGINQAPLWSPSGDWLAFTKNSKLPEVWVVQSDGSGLQQIGTGISVDTYGWSPVEDTLAVAKGVKITLYAVKSGAKAHTERTIDVGGSEANANIGKIAWSPQGQQIAYSYLVPSSPDAPAKSTTNQDGLWLLDLASGSLQLVAASGIPDKGEMILDGWSSDGGNLLFWQGPILSASMMADGVAFYQVAVDGGLPQLLAEQVIVQDGAVQGRPNGMPEVALVEGGGREMWDNKSLHTVVVGDKKDSALTTAEQAVASPVWSPSGDAIAYIGMPAVDGVGGGSQAKAALNQRQLWIVKGSNGEAQSVEMPATEREEAPQWIDNERLLVVHLSADGTASLWQVSRSGDQAVEVVSEISPSPDWFGYYGYVDWRPTYALWRSPTPTASHKLSDFIDGLQPDLTPDEAVALWGQPDGVTGSGLLIYQYQLEDGLSLWLAFPGDSSITYAHLHTPDGKVIDLRLLPADDATNDIEATVTPSA